jgi:hypothetical protein
VGVLDPGNHLDLFVHEVPDIGGVVDVELHQQVVIARGRIDLGGDLCFGERVGDLIGLAELAFDLDEEGGHGSLRMRPKQQKAPRLASSCAASGVLERAYLPSLAAGPR